MTDNEPTPAGLSVYDVPVYPDVATYGNILGSLHIWEGDGWKRESMSWKTGAYIASNLSGLPEITFSGPHAQDFLSKVSINNVYNWPIGTSKHLVSLDEHGLIANHGLTVRDSEDSFRQFGSMPWAAVPRRDPRRRRYGDLPSDLPVPGRGSRLSSGSRAADRRGTPRCDVPRLPAPPDPRHPRGRGNRGVTYRHGWHARLRAAGADRVWSRRSSMLSTGPGRFRHRTSGLAHVRRESHRGWLCRSRAAPSCRRRTAIPSSPPTPPSA